MPIASRDFRELRLERIGRDFGQVHALRDVSLTVGRGEFVALLGPSGCGKSTALNCIAGLLQVTDGAIWLDERRLDEVGPEDRGFGMVFQNYALFPHMTVRRNVGFGLVTQGGRRRRSRGGWIRRWRWCGWRRRRTSCRGSCRAASSSGWRSRAPSWWSRRWC